VRALIAAAARGVRVRLLLAGVTDVPLARLATRRLHHRLLTAGVAIHEWRASVLHAKLAAIDDAVLLIGSFNLDPFSLVNREALVEIADPIAVAQAARWIEGHVAQAPPITAAGAATRWQRWLLGPLGALVDYAATALGRLVSQQRHRRRRRSARRRRAPIGDRRERLGQGQRDPGHAQRRQVMPQPDVDDHADRRRSRAAARPASPQAIGTSRAARRR
jgi:phosphatidylserine/phosphatidylglycerophosphate/cardiolipin synthase-like enzyme